MLIVDDQAARNFSGNFKRAPSRFCFYKKNGFVVSCSGGINPVHSRGDVKVRITLKIILMGNRAS